MLPPPPIASEHDVGCLGLIFSVVAVFFALLGLLPLLGWLNWLTTIPAALLAIIFSALGLSRGAQPGAAALGLVIGVVTLFWALFRVSLGGGVL